MDRIRATRIGAMKTAREGLHVTLSNGRRRPLPYISYEHFSSKT
jgi:hypothetical protein